MATNGNDATPAPWRAPLQTIQAAVDLAQPGNTILIRGGTYAPSTNIQILKNGTASQPITMRTYDAERVIIDGENMPYTPGAVDSRSPGPTAGPSTSRATTGALGLEIIHGPYGIFGLDSNNNFYERLITRDNYESGPTFQAPPATTGSSTSTPTATATRARTARAPTASPSRRARAPATRRGARLWNNSDDGFDAWEFLSPIRIEDTSPTATATTAGTCRTTPVTATASRWAAATSGQPPSEHHGLGQLATASSTTATRVARSAAAPPGTTAGTGFDFDRSTAP